MMIKAGTPVDRRSTSSRRCSTRATSSSTAATRWFEDTRRREAALRAIGHPLRRLRRVRRRGRGALRPVAHAGRIGRVVGALKRRARGDRGEDRRRPVRDARRPRRRRPLRQDGPQRHRVRRHAAHRRGLRRAAPRPRACRRAEIGRRLRRVEQRPLESFLVEITAQRLPGRSIRRPGSRWSTWCSTRPARRAPASGRRRWRSIWACPIPTIAAALDARVLSSLKDERVAASKIAAAADRRRSFGAAIATQVIDDLHDALYAAQICAYAQGMALIRAGRREVRAGRIDLGEMARIWKGGCIIRARLLDRSRRPSRRRRPGQPAARPDDRGDLRESRRRAGAGPWRARRPAASRCRRTRPRWRYFDSYRTARLPQNLTQAQRDAFGAHTYERIDRPGPCTATGNRRSPPRLETDPGRASCAEDLDGYAQPRVRPRAHGAADARIARRSPSASRTSPTAS